MPITLDLTIPEEIYTEVQTDVTIDAAGHQFAMLDWGDGEYKIVNAAGTELTGKVKQSAIDTLRKVVINQAGLTGSVTQTAISEITTEGVADRSGAITALYYLGGGYIAAFGNTTAYLYRLDTAVNQLTLLASAAHNGNPAPIRRDCFLTSTVVNPLSSPSINYTILKFNLSSETITAVTDTQTNANCVVYAGSTEADDWLLASKGSFYDSNSGSSYYYSGKVISIRINRETGSVIKQQTEANYDVKVIIPKGDGEWFLGGTVYVDYYSASPFSIRLNKETGAVSVVPYGNTDGNEPYGQAFEAAMKAGDYFIARNGSSNFLIQLAGDGSMTVGTGVSAGQNTISNGDDEWFLSLRNQYWYSLRLQDGLLSSRNTSGLTYIIEPYGIAAGDNYFLVASSYPSAGLNYNVQVVRINSDNGSISLTAGTANASANLGYISSMSRITDEWFIGWSNTQATRLMRLNKANNTLTVYQSNGVSTVQLEIGFGKYLTFAGTAFKLVSLDSNSPIQSLPDALFANG